MPHLRKKPQARPGDGELRVRGFRGPVRYEILGEPSTLRPGPSRLRGSICTTPEVAHQAFRETEGLLTLESGAQFRITMLGHSAGSDVTYFEMRV
jgi:hypothetical protein